MLPKVNENGTSSVRNCIVSATLPFESKWSAAVDFNRADTAENRAPAKVAARTAAFGAYNLFVRNIREWCGVVCPMRNRTSHPTHKSTFWIAGKTRVAGPRKGR